MRTLVVTPTYDEAENIAEALRRVRAAAPDADVLVVDDGSRDGTARVAREHGAEVVGFPENRGLPLAVAAGYAYAAERGYAYCGRVDADGQHPVPELARLLDRVRSDACDVAVGSRFVSGDGYPAYRYRPSPARRLGTAVLRRAMALVLRRPFGDATSGLWAVNATALPVLARPFTTAAPEVEALIRLADAGLRVEEVPVNMAARAGGVSKLRGGKAVRVVLTVTGALVLAKVLSARRR